MTILDRILSDVLVALESRKCLVSQRELKSLVCNVEPARSLKVALSNPGLGFIAEIKQRSPSKGRLRKSFDVQALTQTYSNAPADAISVLTDEKHFGGSLAHLTTVAKHTHLPVLRKDFIVDPYQLYEARVHGADAVLLIAAILDHVQLRDLLSLAAELNLDCLVEIYDPSELDKLNFSQVSILGVNNRNLHTFEVDIEHSVRVFERVDQHIIKVSESGLWSAKDLAYLHGQGMDAVLIGETFMRADDPGAALQSLYEDTQAILRRETAPK